jgi:hypothetical protein
VAVKYTSPFAKSQAQEDVMIAERMLGLGQLVGPQMLMRGIKVEDVPAYVGERLGFPQKLIRDETERKKVDDDIAAAAAGNPEGTAQAVGMATQGVGGAA